MVLILVYACSDTLSPPQGVGENIFKGVLWAPGGGGARTEVGSGLYPFGRGRQPGLAFEALWQLCPHPVLFGNGSI